MDDDDDEIILTASCYILRNRRKKRKWVNDWFLIRKKYSRVNLIDQYLLADDHFRRYLRMDETVYQFLLDQVSPIIMKQNTVMRESISPHERLSAYLKFVAEGTTLVSLARNVNISTASMSHIVKEVAIVINSKLDNVIKLPTTTNEWIHESQRIASIHGGFPNVLGMIDGKYIRITKPKQSGTSFYCHKGFFAIVLMAVVGANRRFLYINCGANGVQADSAILKNTSFYKQLTTNNLNMPSDIVNNGNRYPYIFLADGGFMLEQNIMTPFRQPKEATKLRYNKVLSHTRANVENAFGELESRFKLLSSCIGLNYLTTALVVMSMCRIHNLLKDYDEGIPLTGTPSTWRQDLVNQQQQQPLPSHRPIISPPLVRSNYCSLIQQLNL